MLKVLAIFEDQNIEATVKTFFEEHKVRFISCQRQYSSFLRMVQYAPHVILMQTQTDLDEKMHLLQLMKKSRVADYMPILVLGPRVVPEAMDEVVERGADEYIQDTIALDELTALIIKRAKEAANQRRKDLGINVNQVDRDREKILLDANTPVEKKLAIMESHIDKLVAFPITITRVLRDDSDVLSSASSLSAIIETDAAVATELLKLANSAYYSSAGQSVSTLRDALVRIGTKQTKAIVMSMSVLGSMKSINYETGFSHKDFWSHSISVAAISQYLAEKSGLIYSEEAFLFGLIHEMGVLLYNEYLNDFFLLCLDKSSEMGFPFTFFQKNVLKLTHNDLMVQLCNKWNFSSTFKEAYKIMNMDTVTEETCRRSPLAAIVMIADIIAHSLNTGRAADSCIWEIPRAVLRELSCEFIYQPQFIKDIFGRINMYNASLSIGSGEFPHPNSIMDGNDEITIICLDAPGMVWSPMITYLKWEGYNLITVDTKGEFLANLEGHSGSIFTILSYMEQDEVLLTELLKKGYHGLIFDDSHLITESYEKKGIVIASYPVDLRNIDLILHFLALGRLGSSKHLTGRLGTLLPMRGEKKYALLVHPSKSIQEIFAKYLDNMVDTIEFANDGEKAIRKAKIAQEDIDWFFIHHELTITDSLDVIIGIKKLSHHKRGKFVLLYNRKRPSSLEMARYTQVGVRRFIDISDRENIYKSLKSVMGMSAF